jgi:hypothetical protein
MPAPASAEAVADDVIGVPLERNARKLPPQPDIKRIMQDQEWADDNALGCASPPAA